jgi:hypothetical protein
VMLYLCLGPAGSYLSFDHWRARRRAAAVGETPKPSYAAAIALRLIQVHLTVVFVMMALAKVSFPVWWNGTAVWWLIANPQDTLVDFSGLRLHPMAINAWTHAILAFELAFPVLIWVPLARPLMIGLGLLIWTSVALLAGLVSFELMLATASLAFVSSSDMRRLVRCPCVSATAASTPAAAH